MLEKLNIHWEKIKLDTSPTKYTKNNSKLIKDTNSRHKITKLSEGNLEEKVFDIGLDNFSAVISKAQVKMKIDNGIHQNLKNQQSKE